MIYASLSRISLYVLILLTEIYCKGDIGICWVAIARFCYSYFTVVMGNR